MSNDDELRREVEALADEFEAAGCLVTRRLEVDAHAAALIVRASPGTLRNWRSFGLGPPSRLLAGRTWYRIADLIEHRDGRRDRDGAVIAGAPSERAESDPLDASPPEDLCR